MGNEPVDCAVRQPQPEVFGVAPESRFASTSPAASACAASGFFVEASWGAAASPGEPASTPEDDTHWFAEQLCPALQVPQSSIIPHVSGIDPQAALCAAHVVGVQPPASVPASTPPPVHLLLVHVCPPPHVPQSSIAVQPSATMPQLSPSEAHVAGTQFVTHLLFVHVCPAPHIPQSSVPAQPSETMPQLSLSEPHVAGTHAGAHSPATQASPALHVLPGAQQVCPVAPHAAAVVQVSSVATLDDLVQLPPLLHCALSVHCTHSPALMFVVVVSQYGAAPAHPTSPLAPWPLSEQAHWRQPAGVFGAVQMGAGVRWLMQLFALLLHSC